VRLAIGRLPSRLSAIWRSDPAIVTAGSVFSRLSILLLYFIAARALDRQDYAFLAYIVGVSAFLQIVFDPSSLAAFVVTESAKSTAATRHALLRAGIRLMRMMSLVVVSAPMLVAALVSGNLAYVALGASVGMIASGESVARFARTEWQIDHRFRRYAAVDVLLGLGRVATGIALVLTGSVVVYALANVVVAVLWQAFPTLTRVTHHPDDPPTHRGVVQMVRGVWPYTASYLSASIYSNGPAVVVGLFGGIAQGALYTIVSRLTQPTELVPQALSAVNLPRLTHADDADRPALFRRQAVHAGVAGLSVTGALLITAPITLRLFRLPLDEAFPLLVVLAAILPLKFLSYQFVALLMAEGNVRARLRSSGLVAMVSVAGVCAVAWAGALPAAIVALACEILLITLLYQAARPTAHEAFFRTHTHAVRQ
jgi:O-antigen/teichoic acid export membrane protein